MIEMHGAPSVEKSRNPSVVWGIKSEGEFVLERKRRRGRR